MSQPTDVSTPIVFKSLSHTLRVIMCDGEPWFVAVDVCTALNISNSSDAVLKLDEDEKGIGLTDTPGGLQKLIIVNESGLYTLILRCRDAVKPGTAAHRFRKWVTSEVLPAIRKTGKYEVPQAHQADHPVLAEAVQLFKSLQEIALSLGLATNAAAISANNAVVKTTGVNLMNLLESTHLIAKDQAALLTPTELGMRFGLGCNKANPLLERAGLQRSYRDHKNRQCWELTELGKTFGVYHDTGKKHSDGTPVLQIKWLVSVIDRLQNNAEVMQATLWRNRE